MSGRFDQSEFGFSLRAWSGILRSSSIQAEIGLCFSGLAAYTRALGKYPVRMHVSGYLSKTQ